MMGKATQDLRSEHDAILHVLDILDRASAIREKDQAGFLKFGGELTGFLKIFADKCHHGKEENFLFEEMVQRGVPKEGGPIGVMLQEHKLGREYIALMATAVEFKRPGEIQRSRRNVPRPAAPAHREGEYGSVRHGRQADR